MRQVPVNAAHRPAASDRGRYAAELVGLGAAYFVVAKLGLDLWLFQVLPDKALHLVHEGDPDSFIQFCGHNTPRSPGTRRNPIAGDERPNSIYKVLTLQND